MNPIIGVTTYGRHEHQLRSTHYDSLYFLPSVYADAVRAAGGIPVMLPPGEGLFPEILDRLDGIIFSGGADIDPERYGGDREHPSLGPLDAERDAAEIAGVKAALARGDVPILCICRGIQILNVALGGNLVEHVPDLGNGDMHRNDAGHWTLHEADIEGASKTAEALLATVSRGTSGHHQAIKTLAAGLKASGWASDGIIEAVEHEAHPWCIGVQWHPEITAGSDPIQQNLFDALVKAAKAMRGGP